MVVKYTKTMKSYCKTCCREVLHEYGFIHEKPVAYEKGKVRKFKKCLSCSLETELAGV